MTKARSLEFIEWDDGSFTLQVADRPANIAREFPLDEETSTSHSTGGRVMRYAIFKDYKGQLRCELVDEGLKLYEWTSPPVEAKYKGLFRRKLVQPARGPQRHLAVQFDDKYYDTTKFTKGVFQRPCLKYRFNDKIRYMKDNYWGPVDVITFITDLKLGEELKAELDVQGKTHN